MSTDSKSKIAAEEEDQAVRFALQRIESHYHIIYHMKGKNFTRRLNSLRNFLPRLKAIRIQTSSGAEEQILFLPEYAGTLATFLKEESVRLAKAYQSCASAAEEVARYTTTQKSE